MSTTYHCAVSVDIDRFTDAKLRRDWLPTFSRSGVAHTPAELRAACARARADGMAVFPFADCDNRNPNGSCAGHPTEETDG